MRITITNRSRWPTAALEVLCAWVARREKITWPYAFTFRSAGPRTSWNGRGCRDWQSVKLFRREAPKLGWPYTRVDHRFKGAFPEEYGSRLELLVSLIAHEAHHATDGNRGEYRDPLTGRVDNVAMELSCNRAGLDAVDALRREWPRLRGQIVARMRRARRGQGRAVTPTGAARLEHALRLLTLWQRREKFAANKVKKYGALARRRARVAAKGEKS